MNVAARLSAPPLSAVTLRTPRVQVRALTGGADDPWRAPVLFLHGESGVRQDDPFLKCLARKRRVIAPLLPGFDDGADASGAAFSLRDMLDFTLHGLDVLRACGLRDPIVMGHSMGGMIAAEMAAVAPDAIARLALIAPFGLWLDASPTADLFAALPQDLPDLLFHDPRQGARRLTHDGTDGSAHPVGRDGAYVLPAARQSSRDAYVAGLLRNARQMGEAGKLLFPIPDRGLSARLPRVAAKTCVIWGESDRVAQPVYGRFFAQGIPCSRLTIIPQAGRMAHWEKPAAILRAIDFLG